MGEVRQLAGDETRVGRGQLLSLSLPYFLRVCQTHTEKDGDNIQLSLDINPKCMCINQNHGKFRSTLFSNFFSRCDTHQLAMADRSSSLTALLTSALCLSDDILHTNITHNLARKRERQPHPSSFPNCSKEHFLSLRVGSASITGVYYTEPRVAYRVSGP